MSDLCKLDNADYTAGMLSSIPADSMVRVHGLAPESVVDGPGLRFAIFAQGCLHNCPTCHNPASHDPNGGTSMALSELLDKILQNPLLSGITLSGGEPFLQAKALTLLAKAAHAHRLDVVTYTGYTLDELTSRPPSPDATALLHESDILIDGPYIASQRNLNLWFRGSANQKVWKKTNGVFEAYEF